MKDFKLDPGSKEKNTSGIFNEKQSDTLSRLNPKRKFSRKERKTNKANELKFQNYVAESKRDYSDFNQKTDSVVTTKGPIRSVTQAHNRMKAKLATLPPVSLKPGETVTRNFRPGPIDYDKEKSFRGSKTGQYIFKMKVKKNSATILT